MKKIILLAMQLFCTNLLAQNLLQNGSFDTNTDNWLKFYDDSTMVSSWINNDGNNQNGSIEIKNIFTMAGGYSAYYSEKISIVAGQKYKLSGFGKVIDTSQASDAGFFVRFFRDDGFEISSSEVKEIFNPAHDNWHFIESVVTAPMGAAFARVAIAVTVSTISQSEFAIARWDDLRFELFVETPNSFAMAPGHTALWYDPNQDGHGINVYLLADQRIIVIWYVYDNQGNPLWLLGVGTHDGVKATLDVTINTGAMFPPDFDSEDVNRVNWGQFNLQFTSCTQGLFKWDPLAGNGFTAGEMNIKRVISTFGLTCTE